ncbi:uncharacterized protein N7446_003950 [Penicillium canescens]|uniref:Uncharacterized protein n=1 Tax=Penicillium canescens TaxID=5083 RepID=A0AAD6I289_PENCN|nr:uncharacterized protein N7446_003950 [Penicillium canescens]KAJ6027458.1 hypothetical protein N7460_012275 [Penicillium canescens]KAJ6040734.1 hypothetical protein N7444_009639 [Penicillium canescens]KAJ6066913.1 hypothetical protein N7446_003950 [Penicillium canescens]
MRRFPDLLVQNVQNLFCEAGCEPKLDTWDKYAKTAVVDPILEDAARYYDAPESKQALIDSSDQLFQAVKTKCGNKLSGAHFCAHLEWLQPFMDCAKSTAVPNWSKSLPKVLSYMSERNCKNANEYLTSTRLWEHDIPKHFSK